MGRQDTDCRDGAPAKDAPPAAQIPSGTITTPDVRTGSGRDVSVTFRTTGAGVAEIDRLADEEERDRSAMIRILLKEAVAARAKRRTP